MAEVAVRLGASEKCLYSGQPEYLAHSTFVFNLSIHHSGYYAELRNPSVRLLRNGKGFQN